MTSPSAFSNLGASSLTISSNTHLPVLAQVPQAMHPRSIRLADLHGLAFDSFQFEDVFHFFQRDGSIAPLHGDFR